MAEITQAEREAQHALDYGLSRDSLFPAAQAEYDRLAQDRASFEIVAWTCESCATSNDADTKYCANCGADGSSAPAQPSARRISQWPDGIEPIPVRAVNPTGGSASSAGVGVG